MLHSRDRALHDEDIGSRFLGDGTEFRRALWNRTHRRDRAAILDLPHPRPDQFRLHRFLINFLQKSSDFVLLRLHDFLEYFRLILVSRLDAFKIEHRQTAELAHRHGKTHVHHSIHGAGQDRNFQFQGRGLTPRQPKGSIDLVRIDRDAARHERDLVETVSHARFSVTTNPHSHIKSNTFEFKSFVQTPAPRAAWEQGIGAIFELEPANDTPQPEAKSFSFASPPVPFTT